MAEERFNSTRSPRYSGGRALGFGRTPNLASEPPRSSAAGATPAQPAIASFDAPRPAGFFDSSGGGGDSSGAAQGSTSADTGFGPSAAMGFATAAAIAQAVFAPNPVSVVNAIQAINNFTNEVPPETTVNPETQTFAPFAISPMAMTADPSGSAAATASGSGIGDAAPSGVGAAPGGIGGDAGGTGIGDAAPSGVGAAPGGIGGDAGGTGIGDAAPSGVGAAPGGVGEGGGAPDGAAGDAGGAGGGDAGGCFITEAVMSAGGQGDNAPELQILRYFRDKVMMSNPIGQSMVQQYEAIAPMVVEAVSMRPDGMQIFQAIKANFIDPSVQEIQSGDMNAALQTYAEMLAWVTPFAIEASGGPGGQPDDMPADGQEPMDDFASGAAMMSHSPEMAAMATGSAPSPALPPQGGVQPGAYTGPMANPPQEPAIAGMFARPTTPPMSPDQELQQPRRY